MGRREPAVEEAVAALARQLRAEGAGQGRGARCVRRGRAGPAAHAGTRRTRALCRVLLSPVPAQQMCARAPGILPRSLDTPHADQQQLGATISPKHFPRSGWPRLLHAFTGLHMHTAEEFLCLRACAAIWDPLGAQQMERCGAVHALLACMLASSACPGDCMLSTTAGPAVLVRRWRWGRARLHAARATPSTMDRDKSGLECCTGGSCFAREGEVRKASSAVLLTGLASGS